MTKNINKGKFRILHRDVWRWFVGNDEIFTVADRMVYLFLEAGPTATSSGLSYAPIKVIVKHTGFSEREVWQAITRLHKWKAIVYDVDTQMVFVRGALYRQYGTRNPSDQQMTGIEYQLERLPDSPAVVAFLVAYRGIDGLQELLDDLYPEVSEKIKKGDGGDTLSDTLPDTLPDTHQTIDFRLQTPDFEHQTPDFRHQSVGDEKNLRHAPSGVPESLDPKKSQDEDQSNNQGAGKEKPNGRASLPYLRVEVARLMNLQTITRHEDRKAIRPAVDALADMQAGKLAPEKVRAKLLEIYPVAIVPKMMALVTVPERSKG